MKQEERTRITYEKILAGAIKEFGTKSYENASLNTICNENHIAKGLLPRRCAKKKLPSF